jgi:sortase family protein
MPSGKHLRSSGHQPVPGRSAVAGGPGPGGHQSRLTVVVAAVVAVLVVAGLVAFTTRHQTRRAGAGAAASSTTAATTSAPSAAPATSTDTGARARFIPSSGTKLQVPVDPPKASAAPSAPVRVDVPSLKISSSLESLGLLPDGTMKPPTKFGVAGWYAAGTRPGAVGPAVIAGHIDSRNGPGIFLSLGQIKVGASIVVTTQTKQKFHFTVTDVKQYPKKNFPAAVVYGPTPVATLRLITCTGSFNYSTRHYLDNLVVTSVLDQPSA